MVDYTNATGYVVDEKGRRQFQDRDKANGIDGTSLIADDRNQDRNALVDLVKAAGIMPNGADETQVTQAVQYFGKRAASSAVMGTLGVLADGDVAGAFLYYAASQKAPVFVYGATTVAVVTTTALGTVLQGFLPLVGGNVTGPMDWGSKTAAATLTHRFWSAGAPTTGTATPDATLTMSGGTPGTANKGGIALEAAELDLSNVASTLLPDAEMPQNPATLSQLRQYCPVGVPQPWPTATPPTGWLLCNGAAFDGTLYPGLAQAYPSLQLPDLRGEFIRGWDNGRGVDSGRALLTEQGDAIRNITGTLVSGNDGSLNTTGAFKNGPTINSWLQYGNAHQDLAQTTFDTSQVVPTAAENRPRNIAFNYIVRAA